jgi:mRNA interferase HigB
VDIVNLDRLQEFAKWNSRARVPLKHWEAVVREAIWSNFQDVKRSFNTADYVRGKIVFDIGGNNYRLIAVIDYQGKQVIVRHVMTHAEYSKGKWK